jgi:hypothetical protein
MTHEIIKTTDYLLVVDDSYIKNGDWFYSIPRLTYHKCTGFFENNLIDNSWENREKVEICRSDCKKIIAHRPLHNAPFLEGVDLLPPLEQEDDVETLAEHEANKITFLEFNQRDKVVQHKYYKEGIIKGYNKAREKYKYTKEGIDKAIMFGRWGGTTKQEYKDFIQSLSQPKTPIAFECEMEYKFPSGREYVQPNPDYLPKTTTNNLGQTQWVGIYVYA